MLTQRRIADFIYAEEQQAETPNTYPIQISIVYISELNTIEVIHAGFEETWEYQMWIDDRLKKLRDNKTDKYYVSRNGRRDITSEEFFKWFNNLPKDSFSIDNSKKV